MFLPYLGLTNNAQSAISPWPKNKRDKEIGAFGRLIYERDMAGLITYAATILGDWTMEELNVWMQQLKHELRSGQVHGWYVYKTVYAQKPEA